MKEMSTIKFPNQTETYEIVDAAARSGIAGKSDVDHTHTRSEITDFAHEHDERYYTELEIDAKVSSLQSSIGNKADGQHNHDSAYDVKGAADSALVSANSYTDEQISTHVHSWDDLENKPFGVGLVNALVENWPQGWWTVDKSVSTYPKALYTDVSTDVQLEDFIVGDAYVSIIGGGYDVVEFIATDAKTLISNDRVDVNGNPTQIAVIDHPTSSDKYRITYTGTDMTMTQAQAAKGPVLYHAVEGIIPIDEQYIPDTIARTEYVNAKLDEKQDKLTGTQGQVAGFDANGELVAMTLDVNPTEFDCGNW